MDSTLCTQLDWGGGAEKLWGKPDLSLPKRTVKILLWKPKPEKAFAIPEYREPDGDKEPEKHPETGKRAPSQCICFLLF